jgi:hypothetical protein
LETTEVLTTVKFAAEFPAQVIQQTTKDDVITTF